MKDKNISATWAGSSLAWGVGLVLILLDMVTSAGTQCLGLYVAGVGGLLNVRTWLTQMYHRELEAFNIGREYERTLRSL